MKTDRAKLICFLLGLVTLVVYWPATSFDFTNYDDPEYILLNVPVQHGLTRAGVVWAFKTAYASNWHPLTWISHMMDCQLFGLNPSYHHLTNLLLHVANTMLLFLLLRLLTGSQWRSACVAALFAWHPLHVESVAWVAERKDVLSTFFGLLAMLAYTRYVQESHVQSPRSKIFYFAALGCFALGLLSKPMLVTLPFVLLLLDYWPLGRFQLSTLNSQLSTLLRILTEKVPFLLLVVLESILTMRAQSQANSVVSGALLPFPDRLANALVSYVRYLGKMVWPQNLAALYPWTHTWTFAQAAAAALLLVVISVLVLWRVRRQPYLAVGWFWYLGTLVPVIGLVQVGIASMADRYTYVPLIGIFIMLVWGTAEFFSRWPQFQRPLAGLTVALLVVLLSRTEVQLQYWQSSVTLFTHTTEITQDNIRAEYNLGEALARSGKEEEAIAHYQRVLAIHPNRVEANYNSQPDAHNNLGVIYVRRGDWADAETEFRSTLRERSDSANDHNNLGSLLQTTGRPDEAIQEFRTAIRLDPGYVEPVIGLARTYVDKGLYAQAITHYLHALQLQPNNPVTLVELGQTLAASDDLSRATARLEEALRIQPNLTEAEVELGKILSLQGRETESKMHFDNAAIDDPFLVENFRKEANELTQFHRFRPAISLYQSILKIRPGDKEALNTLAWVLATCPDASLRNGPEAVRLAEQACQLDQDRADFLGTLDAAYAAAGRFDEAIATAQKCRDLALKAGQTSIADLAAKRQESYRAGKAWLE